MTKKADALPLNDPQRMQLYMQALALKMREDVARYAKLVKQSGVRVEY